jgi:glycerophosphoryl diester phosphodiesterase
MTPPELIAHRGYTLHYPENTLAAVEGAIGAGARYVEVDVQLSRDEVPVLFHDKTLQRICGVEGAVHDRTATELRELRASDFSRFGYRYARERIATLAELVALLKSQPQVTAFVEIKRIALARFGATLVLNRVLRDLKPALRQCVLISYDLPALAAARAQGWPRVGAVIDRWRDRHDTTLRDIRPEFLFCDVAELPRFGKLRFPGAKVAVFEVNDAGLALKLAARGVGLIETFAIGELQREVELLAGETL